MRQQNLTKLEQLKDSVGMVSYNDSVRSSAVAPFGGVKNNGFGRELGQSGLFEFSKVKVLFGL